MDNHGKSPISSVPWFTELCMGLILLVVFTTCFESAIEFREALLESGKQVFLIWTIETWFMLRVTVFVSNGLIGAKHRYSFRKARDFALKTLTNFVPKHINLIQFSYEMAPGKLHLCVDSTMAALVAFIQKHGGTATYIIMVTGIGRRGMRDRRIIEDVMRKYQCDSINVVIIHQGSSGNKNAAGKRRAFGEAFAYLNQDKVVLSYRPEDTALVVADGDSEVPKELIETFYENLLWNLSNEKKIGGVTIHNYAKLDSESPWLIRMYALRFLRRFYMMLAVANVLTGRCSAFLGIFVRDPEFQKILVNDLINHKSTHQQGSESINPFLAPLRGILSLIRLVIPVPKRTFETMTGDDKSSIYHVLKAGYNVQFNPDLYVICHEDLPRKNLWLPDVWFCQLPAFAVRYCRNTLNNHSRLLALGVERLGVLRYISLVFDRYFFWTPIIGLLSTPFLMAILGFDYIFVYVSWLILSRTFMTYIICFSAKQRWSAFYPVILYNEHTVLVLVKIWATVSAISSWTRQDVKAKSSGAKEEIMAFIAIITLMTTVIGVTSGALWAPGRQEFLAVLRFIM